MRHLFLFLTLLFLTGCVGGREIQNYSDRATMYGWVDVSDIAGNHLFNVVMRQYQPETDRPYVHMGIEKFEGGYLFWSFAPRPAAYEFHLMQLQSCLAVICSNTINDYNFGAFGQSPGRTTVSQPGGVYFVGNFKFNREKRTGLFSAGQFSVDKIRGGPSQQALLNKVLEYAPKDHPIVAQRIRAAMR